MIRRVLIYLNGFIIAWAAFVVFYAAMPALSGWIMPEVLSKHGIPAWIMVNMAFMVQVVSTIALISGNRPLMNFTIPFLIFYGVGGLFIFDWSAANVGFQLLNIVMAITAIYIFLTAFRELKLIKLAVWIVAGTVAFVGFKVYQNYYLKVHPEVAVYFDSNR